ncbi:OmpA family protein [Vibrio parahaemolyticus]|uniref:OmpA family protein n=1 Tax=Vibrio parahaemolyticus TaxID=670 RepID=UPI00067C0FAA|nr:OmpA family protein [Vibrio parahaemolyticus]
MPPKLTLSIITTLLSTAVYSQPQDTGNFYVGGNIGVSVIDTDSVYLDGDDHPTSATGGLVLGVNITPYLAFETDYSYLGQMPTANEDKTVDAWSNYLLTRYALSDKAGLYFKLGMSLNDDNWTPSAGAGVHYRLSQNWLLDVGYRWIDDIPDVESDLYEFTVGGRYLFGVDESEPLPPIVEPTPEPVLQEVILSMSAETLFKFDSDEVQPNDALILATHEIGSERKVTIIGHTDSSGSATYNMVLSLRRAEAIKRFMESRGIPSENILTQGRGEEEPIASNATKAGRAQNRRVEIRYHVVKMEE